jgi:hypothetical protein
VRIALGVAYAEVAPPLTARTRAATPATCGVAIDVPAINVRQSTGATVAVELG